MKPLPTFIRSERLARPLLVSLLLAVAVSAKAADPLSPKQISIEPGSMVTVTITFDCGHNNQVIFSAEGDREEFHATTVGGRPDKQLTWQRKNPAGQPLKVYKLTLIDLTDNRRTLKARIIHAESTVAPDGSTNAMWGYEDGDRGADGQSQSREDYDDVVLTLRREKL